MTESSDPRPIFSRRTGIVFAVLILASVVLGAALGRWLRPEDDSVACDFAENTTSESCDEVISLMTPSGLNLALDADPYQGIPAAVDESGMSIGFTLGDPEAPVTITVFSDFTCHACHSLSLEMHRIIDDYVRPGRVRIVYKPISLVTPGHSARAAAAAYCASQQGLFWPMYEQLWTILETDDGAYSFTEETVLMQSEKVSGLDSEAFATCFADRASFDVIYAVNAEARARDVAVAPIVFVNNQRIHLSRNEPFAETLRREIEALLA